MNDKQHYLNLRNSNQLDFQLLFEFYQAIPHPLPKVPFDIFQQVFPHFLQMFRPNMSDYFEYFDQKFNVTSLTKKDGSIFYY